MRQLRTPFSFFASTFLFAAAGSAQVALNPLPSRVVGHAQVTLVSASPNLVEGRELFLPTGIAVDTSSSPPILYVADFGNSRVLAWRNASSFQNGAPADAVIGQRDRFSTAPAGPGTSLNTGLGSPVAVAVDNQGNLYVADARNNRILRFPRPLAQQDDLKLPDMVFGQTSFNANTPNQGLQSPNASTIVLNLGGNNIFTSGLMFDPAGNLWFSDAGNNRVLRYPAAAVQRGANNPSADLVLGQQTFNTNIGNTTRDQLLKGAISQPSGLAMDAAGRLYVCDALNRVLVWAPPASGIPAARIIGIQTVAQGQQRTEVNEYTVRAEGVFIAGGTPFVLDVGSSRIVRFDPFESWPSEATSFSPPGRQFIGQPDATSFRPNRNAEPSNFSFAGPSAAVVANNEVYVADTANHRVLVFPIQNGTITTAVRVAGQTEFYQSAPNYIEGRELFLHDSFITLPTGVQASFGGAGVVIDKTSTPPRLYIADTYNNRVLGYKDARAVRPGDRADIVIGQRDFSRALVNDPTNDVNQLTTSGLMQPAGLAVDAAGNLFVADGGNGRVMRYSRPFEQSGAPRPELILGQSSFFNKITDATSRTMARPFGLALTTEGHLLVSDALLNRVLYFRKPAGGDFSNGQAAEKVFGQPDFSSSTGSTTTNRFLSPRHIATDTDDRLYVCDVGNNRVLIFDSVNAAGTDPSSAFTIGGLQSPHGITVRAETGEIWITQTFGGRVFRFRRYLDLILQGAQPDYQILTGSFPLALTQDAGGNLLIAESANRVGLYFPGLRSSNAANQLLRFAPGMFATLKPVEGASFGDTTLIFDQVPNPIPMPTALGDIQVAVNDVPAPIHFVSPGQINFLIPQATPIQAGVEVLVTRRSTGQILATSQIQIQREAPAFFTTTGDGTGQIAALNLDGSINSPVNMAARGEVITLFGTGIPLIPGLPPDGVPVPGALASTAVVDVAIGTGFVDRANILYSGMAPTLIGVWQLNVKIPDNVAPNPQVLMAAIVNSTPTNQDGTGRRVNTTIAVKP